MPGLPDPAGSCLPATATAAPGALHTVQAATGQTTGVWFVNFCSPTARACKELAPVWEELGKALLQRQVRGGALLACAACQRTVPGSGSLCAS